MPLEARWASASMWRKVLQACTCCSCLLASQTACLQTSAKQVLKTKPLQTLCTCALADHSAQHPATHLPHGPHLWFAHADHRGRRSRVPLPAAAPQGEGQAQPWPQRALLTHHRAGAAEGPGGWASSCVCALCLLYAVGTSSPAGAAWWISVPGPCVLPDTTSNARVTTHRVHNHWWGLRGLVVVGVANVQDWCVGVVPAANPAAAYNQA